MKSQNLTGIILGHKNLGENDKLLFLYTEELGKIKAIAKGARKITSKFTGHLETLNICTFSVYFGPRNTILTEIITLKIFKKIREDLKKLKCGLQIAEITNELIFENQRIEGLADLIEKNLQKLNLSAKPFLVTQSYIVKLLNLIGLIPDFKNTASTLEFKYLKLLNFLKLRPLNEIEKIKLTIPEEKKLRTLLKNMVENQIEKSLKSLTI